MCDLSRLGSALLSSAQRKHRFLYCCAIVGACFDVTVLAWHKYTTVFTRREGATMAVSFHMSETQTDDLKRSMPLLSVCIFIYLFIYLFIY
jgi:hypothetical protein